MLDPLRLITHDHGVFLRREAVECGYTDRLIARQLATRHWHRVRHGAYCFADDWHSASAEARHLIQAHAIRRTTPGDIAFSHTTALLLHGIPVWAADLSRVHVTRLDTGSKRCEPDVDHHVGEIDASVLMTAGGLPTVPVARAVIEAAGINGVESGLVAADHALHEGLCTPEELVDTHRRFAHWPGQQRVHVVLHSMDGRSESPGETRGRWLFKRTGLPSPVLQHPVYDARGALLGFTDYWWPEHRVFGEFDGKVKYGRYLRPGEEPGDAIFREKRREDLIRELLDARCGRLTWADLGTPRVTGERFAALLGVRPLWRWAG